MYESGTVCTNESANESQRTEIKLIDYNESFPRLRVSLIGLDGTDNLLAY